jgi:hypothetical protein
MVAPTEAYNRAEAVVITLPSHSNVAAEEATMAVVSIAEEVSPEAVAAVIMAVELVIAVVVANPESTGAGTMAATAAEDRQLNIDYQYITLTKGIIFGALCG